MAELGSRLINRGHRIVSRLEEAQIVVVNTCAVTSGTEVKTRRMLRQFARESPHIAICVTGCLAQHKARELKQEPNVRWVVGNACKSDLPDILLGAKEGVFCESLAASGETFRLISEPPMYAEAYHRTRFSLKIQEGCDFRCAYCIVPFLRGGARSASVKDITKVCAHAVEAGFKEIVLTGTHIGQYRSETGEGLIKLLTQLAMISGDFRIRLSSLDPRDCSSALFNLIGTNQRFCRHLHLSVQSFCPEVLAAMNRPSADTDSFMENLIGFRTRFPDAGIGGDFIVGFPGETEANFQETLAGVGKVGFSYGHVFRFSKRPMTAAATLSGQIDEKEKIKRSARLREALDQCHDTFVRACIGSHHRIIVEKEEPVTGRTPNYLFIEVPGASAPRNSWRTVTISGMNPANGYCRGVIQTRKRS
jgi:threonylcarbamoyladenosine tRNA methylthiotransferase MtaB